MATFDELMEQLKELDLNGDYPKSWKVRTAGDQVCGYVLRWSKGESMAGTAPICTVGTEAGELVSVWCTQSALTSAMERQNPKVGEKVAIRYLGEETSKRTGATYKRFVVQVERDAPDVTDFRSLMGLGPTASVGAAPAEAAADDPFADEDVGSTSCANTVVRGR
jgi:hypothetical protein